MKSTTIGIILMFTAGIATAAADDFGYGYPAPGVYGYGYDPVDGMANYQQAQISISEQMAVAREMQEGDYRGADQAIRQAEAMKYRIREEQAIYDSIRNVGGGMFGGFGY